MKICFVIDYFTQGGAEKVICRLSNKLSTLGHSISIISFTKDPSVIPEITNKTRFINLDYKGKIKLFKKSTILAKLSNNYNNLRDFDVVISNLPETDRIITDLRHPKKFFCIHNSYFTGYISKKNSIKSFFKILKFRHIYGNKKLIFVSNGAKSELLDIIKVRPNKSCTIYNPFPIKEISEKSKIKLEIDVKDYFIHIGRFNDQKRHDVLLEIFSRCNTNSKLLLVGDGTKSQHNKIDSLISHYNLEERVVKIGYVDNPFPYLRNAKALLLTSEYEGLPTVIIESLICGTFVISYDCPSGPREILINELSEYLVPMGNVKKFLELIYKLDQKKYNCKFSNKILFDENNVSDQYIEFIS